MSFRDNLQHLRASRNMTQEQLAMLLGVSRQSVTKWEAEKSYPEMDKLLKICQVFECSLDDLVTGDLTGLAHEDAPAVPAGPPTDVCGFEEHQQMLARKIPMGVALCILSPIPTILASGVGGTPAEPLGLALLFLLILAALALFIPALMEHSAFVKAHPYVEDFYTERDRATARRQLAYGVTGGIGCIFVGVMGPILLERTPAENTWGPAWMLTCIAVGVWLMVRFGMLYGRTNVAEYNRDAVDELEVEDIVGAELTEAQREDLLGRKHKADKVNAVCGAIMLVATIAGLLLLFVQAAPWFWLTWPVGGLVCGIVAVLGHAFAKR